MINMLLISVSTLLVFGLGFIIFTTIDFLKYRKFERSIIEEIQNDFFVFSFGEMALGKAFEKFLENNKQRFPIDYLNQVKICNLFKNLSDIDDLNKIELFAGFLWWFVLDRGKQILDVEIMNKRVTFGLDNLKFKERGGYKIIDPKILKKI